MHGYFTNNEEMLVCHMYDQPSLGRTQHPSNMKRKKKTTWNGGHIENHRKIKTENRKFHTFNQTV